MPFRIRTKLIIAFLAIIIPYMVIAGIISLYNMNIILKGVHKVEAVTGEMHKSHRLQLALDMALMPVNDYIITGEKRYKEEFQKASVEVERWLKGLEGELAGLKGLFPEEREILKDAGASWRKVNEISQRIFALRDPTGRDAPAGRLYMEEMDYKWAYPAIERLRRWQEIDKEEYREAHEESEMALRKVVIVMIAGSAILLFFGISFALFYSRIFVRPIEAIHESADAIAAGDFKTRLDIKTGDEIEQLANAINEMAAQLDSFYGTLERRVEERTGELREAEHKLRLHAEIERNMAEAVYLIRVSDGVIVSTNPFFERLFGYEPGELVGKHVSIVNAPGDKSSEAVANEIISILMRTGVWNGEVHNIRKDGTTFWCHANVFTFEHPQYGRVWLSMHQDITERKKAEEKIKEHVDMLERFQKVAVKREFRIKEMTDEVAKLKARIVELEGVDKE